MSQLAAVVVVAFGLVLIAFTGVTFAKPAMAERVLKRFASSARTHYIEQVFRLLIGARLLCFRRSCGNRTCSGSWGGPSWLAPQR